eukprot:7948558-Alexandrium_andersonii.AAC.1
MDSARAVLMAQAACDRRCSRISLYAQPSNLPKVATSSPRVADSVAAHAFRIFYCSAALESATVYGMRRPRRLAWSCAEESPDTSGA